MNNDRVNDIENIILSLLPQKEIRSVCLAAFLEALNEANLYGNNKWGVYHQKNGLRLLVGSLIVFTIERGKIWLALDRHLFEISKDKQRLLELSNEWQWDTKDYPKYTKIPSRNGYYTPSKGHSTIWPVIKELHFEFIKKAAKKYKALNWRSQLKHTPELLDYLRSKFEQPIPNPDYHSTTDITKRSDFVLPEEISDDTDFYEGSKQRITVNAYERNPKARRKCITYYGTNCSVCGLDFSEVYGDIGEGFTHVHHVKPLSEIGKKYEIDPIRDLRPVCPNCHAIIHRHDPPYSIEEVKNLISDTRHES